MADNDRQINIRLPASLIERMDRETVPGATRSAFIREMVTRALDDSERESIRNAAHEALERRIGRTPWRVRSAVVDVVDSLRTADLACRANFGPDYKAADAVEVCRMIISRFKTVEDDGDGDDTEPTEWNGADAENVPR